MTLTSSQRSNLDNHKLYALVTAINKKVDLRIKHTAFLVAWFEAVDKADCEFGFRGLTGFDDQLENAIQFLLQTEYQWQEQLKTGSTDSLFPQHFFRAARENGIDLPDDFIDKLTKGVLNEFQNTK